MLRCGVWNRERPALTTAGYNFSVTQMSGSDLVTGGISAMKHGRRPGLFSEIHKKQRSSAGTSVKTDRRDSFHPEQNKSDVESRPNDSVICIVDRNGHQLFFFFHFFFTK